MVQKTSTNNGDSPAMRVMEEAIELAIEERSPYPDRAVFINVDGPRTGPRSDGRSTKTASSCS
ncbi:MAG TPA: hypothetical protein VG147_00645 [Solirubrobacteraceae bacterium]|jgi:hypothetical protein|nr:hypothetical protein [Solirubrobacteraceae bacterium]